MSIPDSSLALPVSEPNVQPYEHPTSRMRSIGLTDRPGALTALRTNSPRLPPRRFRFISDSGVPCSSSRAHLRDPNAVLSALHHLANLIGGQLSRQFQHFARVLQCEP